MLREAFPFIELFKGLIERFNCIFVEVELLEFLLAKDDADEDKEGNEVEELLALMLA